MHVDWHYVEAWAKERLESSRQRNDADLGATDTATLRGRIALLKELIALPESKKDEEARAIVTNEEVQ